MSDPDRYRCWSRTISKRFTLDAKKEARRDGVPPIELVDGDTLVEMFERHELGLLPRRTFDVDEKFFEEYKK